MPEKLFPGETPEKKLSVSDLRRTVRCANDEAKSYLDRALRAEKALLASEGQIRVFLYTREQARLALELVANNLSTAWDKPPA